MIKRPDDQKYCKQCGILLDEELRNSENTGVTDICFDCFDMNMVQNHYDTNEKENKKMSIKYGKKHDAHDFCDGCKINKGCSATKTDVWFFQGNKYCSECLEGQVMSESLQPECDEEQRELRDSIKRECDHFYSPYDE